MDLYEALRQRRSTRRFQPEPVAPEVIERLVEAAHLAPFGTREDERVFVALAGEEKSRFVAFLAGRIEQLEPALREASPHQILVLAQSVLPAVRSAPVVLLAYVRVGESGPLLALGSMGAAVENLLLAAHGEGLGGCWVTGATYLADDIAQYLGAEGLQLVGMIPVGKPVQPLPAPRPRPPGLFWRGFPERPEEPLPARPSAEAAPPQEPTGATVIVADDTPPIQDFIAGVLEKAGYRTLRSASAAAALDLAARDHPDLIIADALLPGMTGYQLAVKLRERARSAGDGEKLLPLLLTTTSYTTQDETYALAAGADGMLDKPLRAHTLLARADALLRVKRLYDEVQALREGQESLTYLIVHDLRTPLTSVIGALNLVQDTNYDADLLHEMVPMALNAGQIMLGLINDLLDVAKMESTAPELNLQDVALAEVFEEVRAATAGTAQEHGLELLVEPPEPPLTVRADRSFLRRALTNLVGNAVKFTPEGSVHLSADGQEGFAVIQVEDTGPGIPEEARQRIFEKFGQVQGEAKQRRGTGLGLTFVKMAAEAMGGRIELESAVGQGSTFLLYVPLAGPGNNADG